MPLSTRIIRNYILLLLKYIKKVKQFVADDRKIIENNITDNVCIVLTKAIINLILYHDANLSLGLQKLCCDHFLVSQMLLRGTLWAQAYNISVDTCCDFSRVFINWNVSFSHTAPAEGRLVNSKPLLSRASSKWNDSETSTLRFAEWAKGGGVRWRPQGLHNHRRPCRRQASHAPGARRTPTHPRTTAACAHHSYTDWLHAHNQTSRWLALLDSLCFSRCIFWA